MYPSIFFHKVNLSGGCLPLWIGARKPCKGFGKYCRPIGGKNFFLSASTDKSLKIVCDKLDALILKCVSEQVCSNVFSTEGLYFVNLNMS